jgi:hypothetical protein
VKFKGHSRNVGTHGNCFMLPFFSFWHYSPRWNSASSKITIQSSRSCYTRLQFLKPIIFRSSSTDSNHPNWGFPSRRIPSGLSEVSFLQGSRSCILKSSPSHFQLFINQKIGCKEYFFFFFPFWYYIPWWTSASSKIALHCSRSCCSSLRPSSSDLPQLTQLNSVQLNSNLHLNQDFTSGAFCV